MIGWLLLVACGSPPEPQPAAWPTGAASPEAVVTLWFDTALGVCAEPTREADCRQALGALTPAWRQDPEWHRKPAGFEVFSIVRDAPFVLRSYYEGADPAASYRVPEGASVAIQRVDARVPSGVPVRLKSVGAPIERTIYVDEVEGQWVVLDASNLLPGIAAPTPPALQLSPAPYATPTLIGHLPADLDEISGLAAGTTGSWAVNDSNNPATLYALSSDGTVTARVAVSGAKNRDWEDLASFEQDGRRYLLIADSGDNDAVYASARLHILPEPAPGVPSVTIERTIEVTFPDGPTDCEAVAVDGSARVILLVTKRETPPRLFSVPLDAAGPVQAVLMAPLVGIPEPTAEDLAQDPIHGQFRAQPTAADVRARLLLVQTYKDAYLYERRPSETWAEAVQRPPRLLDTPQLPQTESTCFLANGSILLSSEGDAPPLYSSAQTSAESRPLAP